MQCLFQIFKHFLVLIPYHAHVKSRHKTLGLATLLVNLFSPSEEVVQFLIPVIALQ